jgi:hypothetical protein
VGGEEVVFGNGLCFMGDALMDNEQRLRGGSSGWWLFPTTYFDGGYLSQAYLG